MSIFRDFQRTAASAAAPATVTLVTAMCIGFLILWLRIAPEFILSLAFRTEIALQAPWTFFTYPFLGSPGFLSLFFLCLWMWSLGGPLERDHGTARYFAIWFLFSGLCALGLWMGSLLLKQPSGLFGGWTPVAALTVIWGTRNPGAQIRLLCLIPITGKWLAWLSAGIVFFDTQPPQMAPFAAAPLALAYFYAANKLPFLQYGSAPSGSRGENAAGTRRVYKKEYYDEVKRREKDRAERERLRKLFEQSAFDDKDKKD